MDGIDRKILSLLQEDGRISATDISRQVGLSLSSCHRRIKELELSGAIERYRAIVSPQAAGFSFEAIVFVTMGHSAVALVEDFERAVAEIPNVIEAERLFGDPDYMLRVLARDLTAYQQMYDETLVGLPGVQRLTSTLVMKHIGPDRTIPL